MFVSNFHNPFHISTLPEQMHWYNGFCAGRDGRLNFRYIYIISIGANVHKDGGEAKQRNHFHRGNEGEWRCDDFVTGLQTQRHHRNLQGIGAIAAGDDVPAAHIFRKVLLEFLNYWPIYKCR